MRYMLLAPDINLAVPCSKLRNLLRHSPPPRQMRSSQSARANILSRGFLAGFIPHKQQLWEGSRAFVDRRKTQAHDPARVQPKCELHPELH